MSRWVVLGAGAVGASIGGLLAVAGAEVVAIARGAQLEALRAGPLRVETPSRSEAVKLDVVGSPGELRFDANDRVLLCVKSQDVPAALRALRDATPAEVTIVCAQNGVGTEPLATALFARVLGMVVFSPALFLAPGRVTLHAEPIGVLEVGVHPQGTNADVDAVVADLRRTGFVVRAEPRIGRLKYGKLLTNVGNALQALGGDAALSLADEVQAEAIDCYRAGGIDFAPMEELAERFGVVREMDVGGVSRGGGSTWQSLARRTGSVETDALNGAIVELGVRVGVPTPLNRALVALMRRASAELWAPGAMTEPELIAALRSPLGDEETNAPRRGGHR